MTADADVEVDPLTLQPVVTPSLPSWLNFNQWVMRAWCFVFWHDDEQRYAADRMYLVCTNCGRETAGWRTQARRPPIVPIVRRTHSKRV